MQNITVKFIEKDGELVPFNSFDAALYNNFKKSLEKGEIIELYITKVVNEDDKTPGQLAKVHASIRELARFTGHTFEEMKDVVKQKAGLYNPASGEFKSFSDCNKKELCDAIEMCVEIGASIGYYF